MPLPATWHPLSDVGAARDQGSGPTHAPTRESIAYFGAVSLRTGKFIRSLCTTFNAATFKTFLKTLRRHLSRDTRMVLVLDNARCHHAVLLKPLHRKYRAVLTPLFLPTYSPQLALSSESGS